MRRAATAARAGLTLIELVIGLAVLAVLCTLAVPALGLRAERQRLQHAAETLAADIVETRFEAARRGQPLHLQGRAGGAWCWTVATAPGCGCDAPRACQLHTVDGTGHPGVRLLSDLALVLEPGGASSARAEATLESSHGERLRVEVSPLGRTRICAPAGTWPRLPPC